MRKVIFYSLSVLKYIIALFMMLAGILTAFGPTYPTEGNLDFFYEERLSLALFGIWFFTAGALLFVGKIFKYRPLVGWGLMLTYLAFLFAGILNTITGGIGEGYGNLLASLAVGALYLRWKLQGEAIKRGTYRPY